MAIRETTDELIRKVAELNEKISCILPRVPPPPPPPLLECLATAKRYAIETALCAAKLYWELVMYPNRGNKGKGNPRKRNKKKAK